MYILNSPVVRRVTMKELIHFHVRIDKYQVLETHWIYMYFDRTQRAGNRISPTL